MPTGNTGKNVLASCVDWTVTVDPSYAHTSRRYGSEITIQDNNLGKGQYTGQYQHVDWKWVRGKFKPNNSCVGPATPGIDDIHWFKVEIGKVGNDPTEVLFLDSVHKDFEVNAPCPDFCIPPMFGDD